MPRRPAALSDSERDELAADRPFVPHETVTGPTASALLGDASPVRSSSESTEVLVAAGLKLQDRCPTCGYDLPEPNHLVDAAARTHRGGIRFTKPPGA